MTITAKNINNNINRAKINISNILSDLHGNIDIYRSLYNKARKISDEKWTVKLREERENSPEMQEYRRLIDDNNGAIFRNPAIQEHKPKLDAIINKYGGPLIDDVHFKILMSHFDAMKDHYNNHNKVDIYDVFERGMKAILIATPKLSSRIENNELFNFPEGITLRKEVKNIIIEIKQSIDKLKNDDKILGNLKDNIHILEKNNIILKQIMSQRFSRNIQKLNQFIHEINDNPLDTTLQKNIKRTLSILAKSSYIIDNPTMFPAYDEDIINPLVTSLNNEFKKNNDVKNQDFVKIVDKINNHPKVIKLIEEFPVKNKSKFDFKHEFISDAIVSMIPRSSIGDGIKNIIDNTVKQFTAPPLLSKI